MRFEILNKEEKVNDNICQVSAECAIVFYFVFIKREGMPMCDMQVMCMCVSKYYV